MGSQFTAKGVRMVPEMEQSLKITREVKKMKTSMIWGLVNAVVLAIVAYDIVYSCPSYSRTAHVIEHTVAALLSINMVFHLTRYLWISFTLKPVALSPKQKVLLGIRDTDYYYRMASSTPVRAPVPEQMCLTPLNMSTNSWLTTSSASASDSLLSTCLNATVPSWLYQSQASLSPYPVGLPIISQDEVIQDDSGLQLYLREYERLEKSSVMDTSLEQPSNMLSGYWTYPSARVNTDISPMLRRCTYQLSTSPAQTQSGLGSADEAGSPSTYQFSAEVWRRNKINPSLLPEWTANLRMWISRTILERVVQEIATVDESLHAQGLVDVTVGVVGLERLRKTARIPQVALNVPSLARLVPFLDLSQNQEYVVARIKELVRGGCMSEYCWSGGGRAWTPALPTDAALVLHLLATYLDCQLPLASLPDSRPFSGQYVVRPPATPAPNQLCIVETSVSPPNYVLHTGSETFHTPKGRNNLLFTVLLFLHIVKTREHGMLGRINLGRSGVNILWIIDSDS